ncbi:extracellular solute-binding protein [Kribbella sp. NPDC050820]|uniref:extracellular solute-binding protein n=1 Tax=Kribbella sp. NPDC050820 TaxID=3155408 RepID=UPI0033C39316
MDTVLGIPNLKGQTVVVGSAGGSFGDAIKKTVVAPFEEATGAKVVYSDTICASFDKLVKARQFASDVDMCNDYGPMLAQSDAGLLKSDPRLVQIAKARGLQADWYQSDLIANNFYAEALAWNTAKYGNDHPSSWAEFFDTSKFKGPRGLHTSATGDLEIALLASGTTPSSLYPLDVDKAFDVLDALRKNATVHFWRNGADSVNQLSTGEIGYTWTFSNRVASGVKQGLPLDMTFKQALLVGSGAAVSATAKNVDGAIAFIDFYMAPSIQAALTNESGVGPAYPAAAKLVDPSMQKYVPTTPENLSQVIPLNNDYWRKNYNALQDRYTKWQSGS